MKKDLRKILIEATEQSGRNIVPELSTAVSFEDSLPRKDKLVVAFHPEGRAISRAF